MNQTQLEKVARFMTDKAMSEAVYLLIQRAFLKKKDGEDVELKAARFMALNLLDEAWRDLDNAKPSEDGGEKNRTAHV